MGPKEILEEQGLKVSMGPGPNNVAAYYITNHENGNQYILTYDEVDQLQKRGKLTISGIEEHEDLIKRAQNA